MLSTLTAAQMRKMMEGVVLYGTGKTAQLNGYSSGGKTGTAQKIDPATHRYSKTMHIASFAGIAPVNNPVIAVAVVIDSPKGHVLRRRRFPRRSLPRWRSRCLSIWACRTTSTCTRYALHPGPMRRWWKTPRSHSGDINALYAAANELPSDDPLRGGGTQNLREGDTKNLQRESRPDEDRKPDSRAGRRVRLPRPGREARRPPPRQLRLRLQPPRNRQRRSGRRRR